MKRKSRECFSYVVVDDCNYAPNVTGEVLTLATCKPVIRRTAQEGDLVIGLTPRPLGNEIAYAMVVDEVIPLENYFEDPRFKDKIPDFTADDPLLWMGDNHYERQADEIVMHTSAHHVAGRSPEELEAKRIADLSGVNVLIARQFAYFGADSVPLPERLDFLRIRRGHRCSGEEGILAVEKYAPELLDKSGVFGFPRTLQKEIPRLEHLHKS